MNVTLLPRRNFARRYCAMQEEFLEGFEKASAILIKINIYGTFFYAAYAQFGQSHRAQEYKVRALHTDRLLFDDENPKQIRTMRV